MLYVIAGGDAKTRAAARRKIWKGPMEELDSALPLDELAALCGTPTLMGEKRAFFVREALAQNSELLDMAQGLQASDHTFIFEEEKVLAKPREVLKKAGAQVEILETIKAKSEFNVFAIADALAKNDRKKLWLLLIQASRQGIPPENVAGVLSWKARTALASSHTAERARWQAVSRELVCIYHDSHRGAGDLGVLLERFALTR